MSNVVDAVKGHLRSKSLHRKSRSSVDPSSLDDVFMRARAQSLRQRALAEEEDDLIVSSPKDKHFSSVPWDYLREREHPDFFSPSATPVSDGPRTPTSAEYSSEFVHFHNRHTFEEPRPAPAPSAASAKSHRRASSASLLPSPSATSAGRKPCLLLKRRPMPMSKSEPSPQTGSFPTINELSEASPHSNHYSNTDTVKQRPPSPPRPKSTNRPSRSIDVLAYRPQRTDSLPSHQHAEPHATASKHPHTNAKPTYIPLPPRPLNLPQELHIHTPEYTNALKQWFPAAAQRDSMSYGRRERKELALSVASAGSDVGVFI